MNVGIFDVGPKVSARLRGRTCCTVDSGTLSLECAS